MGEIPMEERLVSYREMARRLAISIRTLQRWVKEGRFTYGIYHGPGGGPRVVRFLASAILEQTEVDGRRRCRL